MKQLIGLVISLSLFLTTTVSFGESISRRGNRFMKEQSVGVQAKETEQEVSIGLEKENNKMDEESLRDLLIQSQDYYTRLRYQLQQLEIKSSKKAAERGVAINSAIHLPMTKMAFHIIDGALMSFSAWTSAGGNPLKMVEHINSTFDPVAWFSFYIFSASQGYYINFKSKSLSAEVKAKAMRQLMYKGMVVGSLASTLTADVINLFSECHRKRLDKKMNPSEVDKSCAVALQQWTSRNLINKFGPQILNLIANQILSDATELGFKKILANKNVDATLSKLINSFEKKALIAKTAEVAVSLSPVGLEVHAIHYFIKVLQFTNFLAWDHILSPTMYQLGGNLSFRYSSKVDIQALERNSAWISTQRWDLENLKSRSDDRIEKYPEAVLDFSQFMDEWRNQLNKKAEEDLNGWVTVQQNLIHQLTLIKFAYQKLSDLMFDKIDNNKIPNIPLPFYGIDPNYGIEQKKLTTDYLNNNEILQKDQFFKINKTAKEWELRISMYENLTEADHKIINSILSKLKSLKVGEVTEGLLELNKNTIYTNKQNIIINVSQTGFNYLDNLRSDLGNPFPILNPGIAFTYAFSAFDTNAYTAKHANLPINGTFKGVKLNFENSMSYFIYNMICGEYKTGSFENFENGVSLLPPKVVKEDQSQFCENIKSNYLKSKNARGEYGVDSQMLFSTPIQNTTVLKFITNHENLIREYVGFGVQTENLFEKWWKTHETNYLNAFKKIDENISISVKNIYDNYSKNYDRSNFTSYLNRFTTWSSDYLPNNIQDTFMFQTKVLLKLYKNYMNKNNSNYNTVGADFIKNIKDEVSENSRFYVNSELLSTLKKIRTFIIDNYLKKQIISFSESDESFLNSISLDYINTLSFQKEIKQNILPKENNVSTLTKDLNKALFQNASLNLKLNLMQINSQLQPLILDDLLNNPNDEVIKTLKMMTIVSLEIKDKLTGIDKRSSKVQEYSTILKYIDESQLLIRNKFLTEIVEALIIQHITLTERETSINYQKIEESKKKCDLYVQIMFEQYKNIESLKDSKNLDLRFIYAIYSGINSVINGSSRYSNLLISTEELSKLDAKQMQEIVNENDKLKKQIGAKPSNKGFRVGSASTTNNED